MQMIFRFFLPKVEVEGLEKIPLSPYIVVSNHLGSLGPILIMSYWPNRLYPWVLHKTLSFKEAPEYIRIDFVEKELKMRGIFAKFVSFVIALVSVPFLRLLGCIPVYSKSKNIVKTLDKTCELLKLGESILIFAESSVEKPIDGVYPFRNGFLKVTERYVKSMNKPINILPVVIIPEKRKIVICDSLKLADLNMGIEKRVLRVSELENTIRKVFIEVSNS